MASSNQPNNSAATTLFPLKGEFYIKELRGPDAPIFGDHLAALRNLIVANEEMYPNIAKWFDSKVVPGIKSSNRVAYVAYEGDEPIASAVLKIGDRSKVCHLRIKEDLQDLSLGEIFFTQMTQEVRRYAKEVHFTLPESLWAKKKSFFANFGFGTPQKAKRQYRKGDEELICSAPLTEVWSAMLKRLPRVMKKFTVAGYSLDSGMLLSIRPQYADRLLQGKKLVEIRRKFTKKWLGQRASLYATRPVSALVGEATMSAIASASPADIWAQYGPAIGCEKSEFDLYTQGCDQVYAIELKEVHPFQDRISLAQLSHILKEDLRPPQSYRHFNLDEDSPWARAACVAVFLHGGFGFVNRNLTVCDKTDRDTHTALAIK
ncbi:MAG: hypothetical protein HY648_09535 [Acidobacteria bacterium]|nr:hypothetical protein [Acidobacteriota bacterium]